MNNYQFTVTQTGIICVDANSEEEAREKLENDIGHFYVITDNGEQPADDSWEVGEIYDIIEENQEEHIDLSLEENAVWDNPEVREDEE